VILVLVAGRDGAEPDLTADVVETVYDRSAHLDG
jgi:hypothetical protein